MNLETEASADADDALDVLDNLDLDDGNSSEETIADDEPRETETNQADGEEADEDASEEEEEQSASADEDKGSKPKSRSQKRFDKLTREKNDARREAEYERREREALQRRFDQLNAEAQYLQPTREQMDAGQRQGLNPQQVQDMVRQQASEMVEAERFNATVSTLADKLRNEGAAEAYDRFSNPALTNFEPEAISALSESKFPVKIANAIAGNEEVFSKFSSLKSGVERARFIDRLDGRFETREASRKETSANDPKPTPRVRGSARKPEKDPDEMDQAEYEAYARKKGWLE